MFFVNFDKAINVCTEDLNNIMYAEFTVLLYFLISSNIVLGYPVKQHAGNKVGLKDEKKYPNGTVIGKYSYKDKDGNPILVKYFADDSSYGVELKSVKVFGSNPELLKDKPNFEMMTADALGSLNDVETANSLLNKEYNLNKSFNPYEILNSYPRDSLYKVNKKQNDDYEIFSENDFKPSEKCDKQKIRVYSDKTKRKIREANNNKLFCERY